MEPLLELGSLVELSRLRWDALATFAAVGHLGDLATFAAVGRLGDFCVADTRDRKKQQCA